MHPIRRTLAGWLPIVEFCAEEVRRQYLYESQEKKKRAPLAVGWMVNAWWLALIHEGPINVDLIVRLGQYIEPHQNMEGLRRHGVRVGDRICPDWQDVPRLISQLCEHGGALDAGEFYYEFEMIHPFGDGNGRTGKVLFNHRNGTLLAPEFPPSYFGPIVNP